MTQSLTARLAEQQAMQLEKQATQLAEIERITASELQRLGASLKAECEAVLASMESTLAESMASTAASLTRDLGRLRRLGRWWWGTIVVSWATIVMLLGLLLWHWMGPSMSATGWGGRETASLSTFTHEGEIYAMLPEGAQVWTCRQGESRVPCIRMPSLAAMLQGTDNAMSEIGEEPGEGMDGRPSGMLTGGLSVRPPVRPSRAQDGS